jgi:hypothetical protein
MKNNNNKKSIFGISPFAVLMLTVTLALAGCGPMDETYRDFWADGVKVYPAKAEEVTAYPGNQRIELHWILRGDPSITRAKIYWNNRTDSTEAPVILSGAHIDTIKVRLTDMNEAPYAFDIFTFDSKGNMSIPISAVGNVYGENYRSSLLVRFITGAEYDASGKLTVNWGNRVDATSIGTEIVYKNTSGSETRLFEEPDATTTVIDDLDYGTSKSFTVRSAYLPVEVAIDTFYSNPSIAAIKGFPKELPKDGWTATASSFDERPTSYRPPSNAIDGTISTLWANWINTAPYPHTLTVDMGEVKNDIYGFTVDYEQRNEAPKSCQFLYGNDPLALISAGVYDLAYTTGNHFIDLIEPLKNFRYFRLIFTAPAGSTTNIYVREVGVFTRP